MHSKVLTTTLCGMALDTEFYLIAMKIYYMHSKPVVFTVNLSHVQFELSSFFRIAKPNSLFEDAEYLLSTLKVFMSAV